MSHTSGRANESSYRFHEVQDLDDIASVIAFDMEYPLDGSRPAPVEHDPSLDPVIVPALIERELDGGGGYPVSAREMTETLGGTFRQDPASGEAVCSYRGVEIVFRPGSPTALAGGKAVELPGTPAMLDGVLAVPTGVFCDAWGIECTGLREYVPNEDGTKTTIWLGNYIVP